MSIRVERKGFAAGKTTGAETLWKTRRSQKASELRHSPCGKPCRHATANSTAHSTTTTTRAVCAAMTAEMTKTATTVVTRGLAVTEDMIATAMSAASAITRAEATQPALGFVTRGPAVTEDAMSMIAAATPAASATSSTAPTTAVIATATVTRAVRLKHVVRSPATATRTAPRIRTVISNLFAMRATTCARTSAMQSTPTAAGATGSATTVVHLRRQRRRA